MYTVWIFLAVVLALIFMKYRSGTCSDDRISLDLKQAYAPVGKKCGKCDS